jgi:hypothetical protein
LRSLVPILVAAVALPATASATPSARWLSFARLLHGSPRMGSQFAPVLGTAVLVVDNADNAPSESDVFLDEPSVTRINQTNWRRSFVLGVFATWPTRGYDVTIRRISLQHIGGGAQQLCVLAAVKTPAPGRVVLQERTTTYDIVTVRRRPANLVAPTSVVVRGMHGRLLYANKDDHPVRPDVCHAS